MLKSVRVPAPFEPAFARAEGLVEQAFARIDRSPERGSLRIDGERYVMMRADSLYRAWFEALTESFGEETARDFLYNTAREIGRSDAADFARRLGLTDGVDRLASGPVHFAHAGWATVDILDDSRPSTDDDYFLHYRHPNTFESEIALARGKSIALPGCVFSAGYSSGWCSDAFGVEAHGREISCLARGDAHCEFIMAPASRLDDHERRLRASAR